MRWYRIFLFLYCNQTDQMSWHDMIFALCCKINIFMEKFQSLQVSARKLHKLCKCRWSIGFRGFGLVWLWDLSLKDLKFPLAMLLQSEEELYDSYNFKKWSTSQKIDNAMIWYSYGHGSWLTSIFNPYSRSKVRWAAKIFSLWNCVERFHGRTKNTLKEWISKSHLTSLNQMLTESLPWLKTWVSSS